MKNIEKINYAEDWTEENPEDDPEYGECSTYKYCSNCSNCNICSDCYDDCMYEYDRFED